ncbi:sigma-70 family RNA polymerase sigma factor [Chloroflexi bacterium TSY]|nr:sigma-70 family RNA polymerase sigma factor [Chloroflexi bacterium TSY]
MNDLASLVTAAQEGDLNAFSAIVVRFQDMAFATAYARLGDAHLAEDVAQEAFLEAYINLNKLSEAEAFPGWFRTIVVRQVSRMTRGKRVQTVALEHASTQVGTETDLISHVEKREMQDIVWEVIDRLPERERQTTMLFYIGDYTQKEIADYLGVRVSTIKSRLHTARKTMRERMLDMVQDNLQSQRPSNDTNFVTQIMDVVTAAEQGDLSKLGALLERRPELAKAKNEKPGATPLHYAAWAGQIGAAELLLSYGADVNLRDDSHTSAPIGWAHENGQSEMVDFFLEHGAEISLRQAASWGKIDRVRSFLDRDPAQANNETEPMLPIHGATLFGHLDIVSLLVERGADLDHRDHLGRTALNIALLRPLPLHGDSYNLVDEKNLGQIANLLIQHGAEVSIWDAAALGRLDLVRTLIQDEPQLVNARHLDYLNLTPLYNAALFGSIDIVELLVENGAEFQAAIEPGYTPLHAAAWTGNVEIAKRLLAEGANIHSQAKNGATPLHCAVWRGHLDFTHHLLDNGADVNAKDAHDRTPLDLAQANNILQGWELATWGPPTQPNDQLIQLLKN